MAADTDKQSFWEHLDVLRAAIVKSLLVAVVFGVAAFCFKEELFAVILAPKDADFITYRLLYSLGGLVTESGAPDFLVKLINTGLAGQFIIHMKAALCAGVLCASPYILYQLFRFVSPALYVNERKYVVQVVGGGYAMFALGVAVSYFLIFPLTFRFLGTYQVSGEVENMIALQSYISTLMTMSLAMGLVFEIPILSAVRQTGIPVGRFYAQIPQTRHRGYSCGGSYYYADFRCIYAFARESSDMDII